MATTYKVCRDLAHAVELYEAGLLTVDMDTSLYRNTPCYLAGNVEFDCTADLIHTYNRMFGWRERDFGYLEED